MNYSALLQKVITEIKPADQALYDACLAKWDSLAMPLRSLGDLQVNTAKMAACMGTTDVCLDKRTLIVVCADNGVIANGVTQSTETVTTAVAMALGTGTSTANYMATAARCDLLPVDIGMKETGTYEGVLNKNIRPGTDDLSKGPAMSRKECMAAMEVGITLVKDQKEAGTNIILIGEMGIGNTTTTAAVGSVLLGQEPVVMTGRGAGLSDEGLQKKIKCIEDGIRINQPDAKDPVDVIAKVGGLDIACLCGICLGGAYYGVPVLLDGVITNIAALAAIKLNPAVKDAVFASHVSLEPAAQITLEALGMKAPIHANLHLGEGTGATVALSMYDVVLAEYNSNHSFDVLGIDEYTEQYEGQLN